MEIQLVLLSFIVLTVCLSANASVLEDGLKLELASVVFRHGDRSPIFTFPTDPYTESDWPQGYGQLSKVGMQQQYHLGELLKARYVVDGTCDGLICDNYTRVQVRIRSTDIDRTLMSAESQLAALFSPGPNQMFNDSLPWQPVPIHTVPVVNDTLLLPQATCPVFAQLQETDKHNSSEYAEYVEKYKDFVRNLSSHVGMNLTFSMVLQVSDTLKIEHESPDHTAPSWATDDVRSTLQEISTFSMFFMFNTVKKRRLSAGPWIGKVLDDMKDKANSAGNQDMKLFLYSAHDSTVAAFTSGLNVTTSHPQYPGYATAFAVELYSNETSGEYFVRMFIRRGPDSDTFDPLNATFCENPTLCTLEEFEKYADLIIPSDLAKECAISTPTSAPTTPMTTPTSSPQDMQKITQLRSAVIGLGSALGVALILNFVLIIMLVGSRLKSARSRRLYSALNTDT